MNTIKKWIVNKLLKGIKSILIESFVRLIFYSILIAITGLILTLLYNNNILEIGNNFLYTEDYMNKLFNMNKISTNNFTNLDGFVSMFSNTFADFFKGIFVITIFEKILMTSFINPIFIKK